MGDHKRKDKQIMPQYEEDESSSRARRKTAMTAQGHGDGGGGEDGNRSASAAGALQILGIPAQESDGPLSAPAGGRQPPAAGAAQPADVTVARPPRRKDGMGSTNDYDPKCQQGTEATHPQMECRLCHRRCFGVCVACVFKHTPPEKLGATSTTELLEAVGDLFPQVQSHEMLPPRPGVGGVELQRPPKAKAKAKAKAKGPNRIPMALRCPDCRLREGAVVLQRWSHTCICDVCRALGGFSCQICPPAHANATVPAMFGPPPPTVPQPPLQHPRGRGKNRIQERAQPPPPVAVGVGGSSSQRPPQAPAAAVPPDDSYGLCSGCAQEPARPRHDPQLHGCLCEACSQRWDIDCAVCDPSFLF